MPDDATSAAPSRLPWPARFVLLAMIWGLSFFFIKVADEAVAPVQVALARMAIGAVTLLVIVAARRQRLPRGRVWGHLAVAAALFNAIPFVLFAEGERHVTSVVAGIWNGTTPLFTLPFVMLALKDERPSPRRLGGLGVGFGGVLVVLGVWRLTGGGDLEGNLLCMCAAVAYGLGFTYTRRFIAGGPQGPLSLAAGQVCCGALELAVVAPFVSGVPASLPWRVVASLVALGALGTGVAFVINFSIIRDVGAMVASTVTYVIPIFAALAGIAFLHERLMWNEPVGALVVIAGSLVAQGPVAGTGDRLAASWRKRREGSARARSGDP